VHEHPQADRIILTQLRGAAWHHARWQEPTEAETAAAVAQLGEILAGRDDGPALLAETAGLMLGYREGTPDEPRARAAAHFLAVAGADPELVGQWIAEGRHRNRWLRPLGIAGDRPG
jgi:hypothetical protein